jgi:hypothetical protein
MLVKNRPRMTTLVRNRPRTTMPVKNRPRMTTTTGILATKSTRMKTLAMIRLRTTMLARIPLRTMTLAMIRLRTMTPETTHPGTIQILRRPSSGRRFRIFRVWSTPPELVRRSICKDATSDLIRSTSSERGRTFEIGARR